MNKISVGSVHATGYIIRKASVYLESSTDIEDPKSTVKIDIVADLVWVGKSNDSWSHSTDTTMQMDMDKEKFLINGNVVEVINGKEMCRNIMRLLVSSVKIKTN